MPFEVLVDGATIMRAVKVYKDDGGKVIEGSTGYEHEGSVRLRGEILEDDEVSPLIVQQYDAGNEHTRRMIKRISKSQADTKRTKQIPVDGPTPTVPEEDVTFVSVRSRTGDAFEAARPATEGDQDG